MLRAQRVRCGAGRVHDRTEHETVPNRFRACRNWRRIVREVDGTYLLLEAGAYSGEFLRLFDLENIPLKRPACTHYFRPSVERHISGGEINGGRESLGQSRVDLPNAASDQWQQGSRADVIIRQQ